MHRSPRSPLRRCRILAAQELLLVNDGDIAAAKRCFYGHVGLAAMLMLSPSRLLPSTMTSPTCKPMRNCMHRRVLCGYRGLHPDAQCTAPTALAKSATTLSPAVLKMRPRARRDHSIDETPLRGTDGSNPSPSSGEMVWANCETLQERVRRLIAPSACLERTRHRVGWTLTEET